MPNKSALCQICKQEKPLHDLLPAEVLRPSLVRFIYKINLKAELEIRHLHEKVDHLVKQQWQRLVEIQQIQLELMEELSERKRS